MSKIKHSTAIIAGKRSQRKQIRPPQPSLFKRNTPRIAVLHLGDGKKQRGHQFTYGLDAVCDELSVNIWGVVSPQAIDDYDIVLCSLCSPEDTLALACSLDRRPQSKLIVGGQGVYPFRAWRHLTHRIAFGRAEDAVDSCVLGSEPLAWCYDYDRDPALSGRYLIRQARRLLKGESAVGCQGACKFCQYRATRRLYGGRYHAAGRGYHVNEDLWSNVQIKSGHQTTALDGLSEATRRKVGKPVSDEQIVAKLDEILATDLGAACCLKVFQIVGYPWETPDSVRSDILHFRQVLGRVKPGPHNGRVLMMITVTPFSPEPLTQMEDEPANIEDNWRDILLHDDLRCIFDSPHLNAFFLPQIPGALTLYRRVAVNRGASVEQLRGIAAAKTIEDAVAIGGDLHAAGAGLRVSNVLTVEKMPNATKDTKSELL
jgi:hypothetical protein